jgi:hypothetical protein
MPRWCSRGVTERLFAQLGGALKCINAAGRGEKVRVRRHEPGLARPGDVGVADQRDVSRWSAIGTGRRTPNTHGHADGREHNSRRSEWRCVGDWIMDPELTQLSLQLANTAVRNSASAVAERINSARSRRRDQETIAELEEIVNELVADKAELVRIAQAYEEEFVAQRLSSENVEYIIGSVVPVLNRLVAESGDETAVQKMMDLLQPVLSVETLTVLQLVGFNFKRAIGEPLTEVLHQRIMLLAKGTQQQAPAGKRR